MNYMKRRSKGWFRTLEQRQFARKGRRPMMKNTQKTPAISLEELSASKPITSISEQPFDDHLDHLQALEREATLFVLAFASQKLTSRKIGQLADDKDAESDTAKVKMMSVSTGQFMQDYELTKERHLKREAASKIAGNKLAFVEFCKTYDLDENERLYALLLLLTATSPKFRKLLLKCRLDDIDHPHNDGLSVGFLLELTCPDFREQLEAHSYFSVDGTLVREDLIEFDSRSTDVSNILTTRVTLQDSCIRYCLGDRNLYNATFKYIRRETGCVSLDRVVLPELIKQDVAQRLDAFYKHRGSEHASRLDEFYGYGTGLAMLFHGPSGTGKTMLAQALSNHFQKQLFYMTEQSLQDMPGGYDDIFQTIFREANLHNGIVFFDEADDLFQEGSTMSRELLLALEKSHCVTILATNKPVEMDPAMERRLSMKIAFSKPDACMRETIWKALIPDFIQLDKCVDIKQLAEEFQFSGGLIKNTLVMAISNAFQNSDKPEKLTQKQLVETAHLQLEQAMAQDPLFSTVNEQIYITDLSL